MHFFYFYYKCIYPQTISNFVLCLWNLHNSIPIKYLFAVCLLLHNIMLLRVTQVDTRRSGSFILSTETYSVNRLQPISPLSNQGIVRLFPQILVSFSTWRKLGSDTAQTLKRSKKMSPSHFIGKERYGHLDWRQWLTMSLRVFHNKLNLPPSYYLPWKLIEGQLHYNSVIDRGWQYSNIVSFFFFFFCILNVVVSFVRFKIPLKPVSSHSPPCPCTYRKRETISSRTNLEVFIK